MANRKNVSRRVLIAALGFLLLALCAVQPASAQSLQSMLASGSSQAADLVFPAEASSSVPDQVAGMRLYKPQGDGPFPALLVVHSCGGLRDEIQDWAKLGVAKGYAVMVLDSLGPRGLKTVCIPPTKVPVSRGTKDAFQALAHLKSLSWIDPNRIGLIGFSWGAIVGEFVSSEEVAAFFSRDRFAAVASFYPMCAFNGTRQFPLQIEYLRQDVTTPLLVLMGERDEETPAKDCLPRLDALKAKGAPVEWHLYPKATHCWDCRTLDGFTKTDFQLHRIYYAYDRKITEDSANKAFEFFDRRLKRPAAGDKQ